MRPRALLLLALLVAGLGAFIWFYERELPSSEERAERSKRLLPFEASEVEAVLVEQGERRFRLERERTGGADEGAAAAGESGSEGWRLVEPIAARADRAAVSRMLDTLVGLEKERALGEVEPAETGLGEPRATVTLERRVGNTRLLVGAEVPGSETVVVGVEGDDGVYLVSDRFWSDLTKEAGDWRDKAIFGGQRDDIERVTLSAGDRRVLLARRGDDFWVESPIADRAADQEVTDLLFEIVGLRARRFLDAAAAPPEELGLTPPAAVVEVFVKGEAEPLRLELGETVPAPADAANPDRYLRAGGELVEARTTLLDSAQRAPEEWRSRHWSGFDVYEVEGVRVRDERGELALEKSGGNWKRGDSEIAYAPGSDLLYAVDGAEGEELVSLEDAGRRGARIEEPALTLTLRGAGGREETLTLYPELDGRVPARTSDREVVLLLPASTAEDVRDRIEQVRSAEPLGDEDGGEASSDAGDAE